jgi:H+-transporting ATPase
MEVAALITITVPVGKHHRHDWQDFTVITVMLLLHSFIGFKVESNLETDMKEIIHSLAPKAKVKRDGSWVEIEAAMLVPGDMISFKIGDIVPADCRLTEAITVSIDQAALTRESLPVSKKEGDQCFS